MKQKLNCKTSFYQKCFCSDNIPYVSTIICLIFILLCGFYLSRRLEFVKEQLNSCRSSRISG